MNDLEMYRNSYTIPSTNNPYTFAINFAKVLNDEQRDIWINNPCWKKMFDLGIESEFVKELGRISREICPGLPRDKIRSILISSRQ